MKGILITILIAVSYTANIYGKNNDVIPRLAVKTLSGIYPMAEDIIWFKKAGGDMEVRFSQHDQSYNLNFSASGQLQETYLKVTKDDLPVSVKVCLSRNFTDCKISKVYENICCFENRIYMVEAYQNHKWYQLRFDKNGKLVRYQVKPFAHHRYL